MENAKSSPRRPCTATAKGTYAPALTDAVAQALRAPRPARGRAAAPVAVQLPALPGLKRTWTLRQLARRDRWQLTHAIDGRRPATFTWSRDIDAAAARMAQLDRAAQDAAGGRDA